MLLYNQDAVDRMGLHPAVVLKQANQSQINIIAGDHRSARLLFPNPFLRAR
jgi:hypothetical protein